MKHPFYRENELEIRCVLSSPLWDETESLSEDALIYFGEHAFRGVFVSADMGEPVLLYVDVPAPTFLAFFEAVGRGHYGRDVSLEVLGLYIRPIIDECSDQDGSVYYPRASVELLHTDEPVVTFSSTAELSTTMRKATTYRPTAVNVARADRELASAIVREQQS